MLRPVRRGGPVSRTILIPLSNTKAAAFQISCYVRNCPPNCSGRRFSCPCYVRNIFTDRSPDRVHTIPEKNPFYPTLLPSQPPAHHTPRWGTFFPTTWQSKLDWLWRRRMLDVNAVNEYSDFEMYDGTTFNKKEIVKNVEDKMILCVVGKLVNVG